jgi:Bacterial pre-peptidase C-terminal domain
MTSSRVSSESLRNGSVVNIFGGSGKNTYLISVDASWSPISSTIHIWDFDPSKDTIIFASTNGVNPNIKEAKRTLFNSTFNTYQNFGGGNFFIDKTAAQSYYDGFINTYHNWYINNFTAAQHVLKGEGVPTIVLDERNYNPNNPDSLFNANALKWTPTQDIGDSIAQGNTSSIRVSTNINTQFSQIDSNSDHDLFKVHLSSGYSYVFTMNHNPLNLGTSVLDTSLVLKDKNGRLIANNFIKSTKINGDSLIEYVAVEDGDFYLDASGSAQGGLTPVNGKYAISTVEIPHNNIDIAHCDAALTQVGGVFDGIPNHVGYKVSLKAGEYVNTNIMLTNGRGEYPELSSFNNDGRVYQSGFTCFVTKDLTRQSFLVQKTGDYFIEATLGNPSTGKTQFELFIRLNDIEGSKSTMADLSINTVVTSNLYQNNDHDWFRVSLGANKKYQFDLKASNSPILLDTLLTLRDSNGKQLAFNDDYADIDDFNQPSAGNRDSQLIYTAKTSGDYYIDASSFGEQTKGAYTLSYKVI